MSKAYKKIFFLIDIFLFIFFSFFLFLFYYLFNYFLSYLFFTLLPEVKNPISYSWRFNYIVFYFPFYSIIIPHEAITWLRFQVVR
jgi:hypothetical protein